MEPDPLFHLLAADEDEPQAGVVIVLRTSRSMPRFSVVSVPAMATCGPAPAATAAARSPSPSVQTATGAAYRSTV